MEASGESRLYEVITYVVDTVFHPLRAWRKIKRLREAEFILHVILYPAENRWWAHCLEFDLLGDGPGKEAAIAELKGNVNDYFAYARERALFPRHCPAPDVYWQAWQIGDQISTATPHITDEVQSIRFREVGEWPISQSAGVNSKQSVKTSA